MSLDIGLIIAQLNAPSYADRIAALRCIKNDVVGHRQRKERWVHRGILRTLVLIVTSVTDVYNSGKDAQPPSAVLKPYTLEETARLHAVQLLTSFANGMLNLFLPYPRMRSCWVADPCTVFVQLGLLSSLLYILPARYLPS